MPQRPALVWFRDDLRLTDHVALDGAARSGRPLLALYVLDDESPHVRPLGGAARWWLAGSLRALGASLARHGVRLVLKRGPAGQVVPQMAAQINAGLITFLHRSGPAQAAIDADVTARLQQERRAVLAFPGHLLHEPGAILTRNGSLPRTFAAFMDGARRQGRMAPALPAPHSLRPLEQHVTGAIGPDDFSPDDLEPHAPDWAGGLRATWVPGEAAAAEKMADFLTGHLRGYGEGRDFPARAHASTLSAHLRFGDVSPRQLLQALHHYGAAEGVPSQDVEKFEAELYWREFSHHLLFAFPQMARENLQAQFNVFGWRTQEDELRAWQQGRTGYPLVDAGMRQLWQTGWMHNRVRMVVASFLTKHLMMDWRVGEAWFWETLVDADIASNPANWQWVAGTGMDAAPYFRIFNPVLQGEKFDAAGAYVRAYVPELARLPDAFIHKPWMAGEARLAQAGIRLGKTYPAPIVDHAAARTRALLALEQTRRRD